MTSQRAIQLLTIASFLLGMIGGVFAMFEGEFLPPLLQAWQESSLEEMSRARVLAFAVLAVLLLVAVLVATVGLLLLKKWGAWLHLGSSVIGYAALGTLGPVVEHAFTHAMEIAGALLSGCLYGVAFFTPALDPLEADKRG